MSTAVKLGLGSLLKRGSTTIPEITQVTVDIQRDQIDVTSHDSTAPGREHIPGLYKVEVNFNGNFLPGSTNQKLLTTDLLSSSATAQAWHVSWVDGPLVWDVSGYVISFSGTATPDGKLACSGKIIGTGVLTVN